LNYSGKVVNLDDYRPHLSGAAICLACKYEWWVVAPVGTVFFECPRCECFKGTFQNPVERDCPHWQCECGNSLFYVTEWGYYCPMCGKTHEL